MKRICLAALALLALCGAASAQTPVKPCIDTVNASLGTHDCLPVSSSNPLPINVQSTTAPAPGTAGAGYPPGATPVSNQGVGTTGGSSATLPAAAGKFTYTCGISVETGTATAAITLNIQVVSGASVLYQTFANAPVFATTATAGPIVSQTFTPCLPSSAVNTTMIATIGALGTGGVSQAVNIWGYQQ